MYSDKSDSASRLLHLLRKQRRSNRVTTPSRLICAEDVTECIAHFAKRCARQQCIFHRVQHIVGSPAAALTASSPALTALWSRAALKAARRAFCVGSRAGSIGNTSGSGSLSIVNRLSPTITRSSSSIDFVYSYADCSISSCWK